MEHKDSLWKEKDPLTERICAIPQIVASSDDRKEHIISSCISLKTLFERKHMDEAHVDCLVLYRLAINTLQIMKELRRIRVFPGIYDLNDLYADLKGGYQVFLLHPERFQLKAFEQDYEWYPEDERVFAGLSLFDEVSQDKADLRLLFKILTASTKGNVKVPPRETRADYSSLFYKTLSPELKEIFLNEKVISHEEMERLLDEAVRLERESARSVRERLKAQAMEQDPLKELTGLLPDDKEKARELTSKIYTMYVILRTETTHSGRISRMLYEEQDRLELLARLMRVQSFQAFAYGQGNVAVRPFRVYPQGFRIQFRQSVKEYSAAQTIIVACEIVKKEICKENLPPDSITLCLITDGRLKNDRLFRKALEELTELSEQGCHLHFLNDPDYPCEACDSLRKICGDA